MPQTQQLKTNFAALTFEIVTGADGVTTEAHLLPPGPFRSDDVRPRDCPAWQLDASIAGKLIALASGKSTDMLVDWEHQSLRCAENGKPVPAAGWCPNSLEWREGKGLYATNITWTDSAKRQIASKEYRYISCVFSYAPKTGEVAEIVSFALTNTPAIDGLDALADMARAAMSRGSNFSTTGVNDMEKQVAALTAERDTLKQSTAALTAERDTLKTSVAALTTERDTLKAKVDAVEKEKAEAALAAEKAKHGELLQAALTIVPPVFKPTLDAMSVAQLTALIETSKPLAMLNKQTDGNDGGGAHGLNETELAMCNVMKVKPEDFIKSKAA